MQGLPHHAIVRMVKMAVPAQVMAMEDLLASHRAALEGRAIITVTDTRVRVRLPRGEGATGR